MDQGIQWPLILLGMSTQLGRSVHTLLRNSSVSVCYLPCYRLHLFILQLPRLEVKGRTRAHATDS